jgi:hypothetical protein
MARLAGTVLGQVGLARCTDTDGLYSAAAQPMSNAERGGVRLAILMLACFAREMDVFCSLRKDGKRGDL